jgi:hypothetical protein
MIQWIDAVFRMLQSFAFWLYSFIAAMALMACGAGNNRPLPSDPKQEAIEKNNRNLVLLAQAKKMIQTGDLLLRGGLDFSSRFVKILNKKDTSYSHAGIAMIDSGRILVYHIIPDHTHTNDRVRLEKIDDFWRTDDNNNFAIARFKTDTAETVSFLNYLKQQYNQKVRFDMDFQLKTDNELYCSEMIAKGIYMATKKRISIQSEFLNDESKYKLIGMYYKKPREAFANREIIPIDQLFLHNNCTVIKRFTYE